MGFYLEPALNVPGGPDKEAYLRKVAIKLHPPEIPDDPTWALVCLIENRHFMAAGVCYCQEEMEAFLNDGTDRRRTWWILPKEKVYEAMSPSEANALRRAWGEPQYEPRHV